MLVTAMAVAMTSNLVLLPGTATARYLTTRLHPADGPSSARLTSLALIHGYTTAFWWAAGILAAGAVISGALLDGGVLAGQGDAGREEPPAAGQRAGQPAGR